MFSGAKIRRYFHPPKVKSLYRSGDFPIPLLFQCFEEPVEGLVGIAALAQQLHELRAYDGTGGIILRCLKCLGIGDAEANHAWIAQLHGIDVPEILLSGLIKGLLRSRDGRRADHVDEAVGVVVDEAYALLRRLRGDEHDDAQVVTVWIYLYLNLLFFLYLHSKVKMYHL